MLRTVDNDNGRAFGRLGIRRIGKILFIGVVGALGLQACISTDSPLVQDSAKGCPEFKPGQAVDGQLAVDPTVREFMSAASDFAAVAETMRGAVFTACANIATDLGVEDTWSRIDDP